ncbi:MAG: DeoR/GlpR family DNA-binding transcription regulator [Anaerolineae bacterium]
MNDGTLLAVERQRIILDILRREGVVRSAELRELLNVSLVTIRNDLRELERAGECEIIWGGAVSKQPATEAEVKLDQRGQIHRKEKQRIGAKAAELVEAGQTIIVDAGTTTIEFINSLPRDLEYLRVVTPALNVAVATSHFPNVELFMPGGVMRNLTRSLIGPQTLRSLEMFNADWAFLATGGFSLERGVTTSNILEVEVKRTIVRQAARVALLADSSKFGRILSLTVAPIEEIDVVITDTHLRVEDADALRALGIEVWCV